MKTQNVVRAFLKKQKQNSLRLKFFINTLFASKKRQTIAKHFIEKDKEVWAETSCLSCSNCCRTMTPTYTATDMKRIATHLQMSVKEFQDKWLYKERGGDWRNVNWPCQFLDKKTNYCTIYEQRPLDCASFPHHHKKGLIDYAPMLKQNVSYCPATNLLIEKMYAIKETLKA